MAKILTTTYKFHGDAASASRAFKQVQTGVKQTTVELKKSITPQKTAQAAMDRYARRLETTAGKVPQYRAQLMQLNAMYRQGKVPIGLYRQETARLERQLQNIEGTARRSGKGIGAMGAYIKGAGIGTAIAGITASLGGFVSFDAKMRQVGGIMNATGDQMNRMSELAKHLGATTQFSAGQAADALKFLGMAGNDAEVSMQALPHTLNLAAAANLEMGQAADIVTNAMAGFGLGTNQLGATVDAMTATFTNANTDLVQLGEGLGYAGPVASSAGISFNETAAAIGLMGNAGIQASRAGTALSNSITRLLTPTDAAQAAMDKLGLTAVDSSGKLLPLDQIIQQLEPHANKTAEIMTIFGQRAGPAMAALATQGSDALRELTAQLDNSAGSAQKLADVNMEGPLGAMRAVKSAAEAVAIALMGLGGGGALTDSLNGIASGLRWVAENADVAATAITALAAVMVARLAGPAIATAVGSIATALAGVTTAAGVSRAAVMAFGVAARGALALIGGPAGLAMLAAFGIYELATQTNELKQVTELANAAERDFKIAMNEGGAAALSQAQKLAELRKEQLKVIDAKIKAAKIEVNNPTDPESMGRNMGAEAEVYRLTEARKRISAELTAVETDIRELKTSAEDAFNGMSNGANAAGNAISALKPPAELAATATSAVGTAAKSALQKTEQAGDGAVEAYNDVQAAITKSITSLEQKRSNQQALIELSGSALELELEIQSVLQAHPHLTRAQATEQAKLNLAVSDELDLQKQKNEATTRASKSIAGMIQAGNEDARIAQIRRVAGDRIANIEQKILDWKRQNVGATEAQVRKAREVITANETAKQQESQRTKLVENVNKSIHAGVLAVVDGSKSASQAWKDWAGNVKSYILDIIVKQALGAMGKALSGILGGSGDGLFGGLLKSLGNLGGGEGGGILGGIGPAITGALSKVIPAITGSLSGAGSAVMGALGSVIPGISSILGGGGGAAMSALSSVVPGISSILGGGGGAAMSALSSVVPGISSILGGGGGAAMSALSSVVPGISSILGGGGGAAMSALSSVVPGIGSILGGAGAAVTGALGPVLAAAGPVGLGIAGVTAAIKLMGDAGRSQAQILRDEWAKFGEMGGKTQNVGSYQRAQYNKTSAAYQGSNTQGLANHLRNAGVNASIAVSDGLVRLISSGGPLDISKIDALVAKFNETGAAGTAAMNQIGAAGQSGFETLTQAGDTATAAINADAKTVQSTLAAGISSGAIKAGTSIEKITDSSGKTTYRIKGDVDGASAYLASKFGGASGKASSSLNKVARSAAVAGRAVGSHFASGGRSAESAMRSLSATSTSMSKSLSAGLSGSIGQLNTATASAHALRDALARVKPPRTNGDAGGKGHATGIRNVPHDRYPAILHREEQVLPAIQSRALEAIRVLGIPTLATAKNQPQNIGIQPIIDELRNLQAQVRFVADEVAKTGRETVNAVDGQTDHLIDNDRLQRLANGA